jgi:hypothetical protein
MALLGLTEPRGSFRVTYCVITEDSAACGDHAHQGYIDSWGAPVDDATASDWDLRDLLARFEGCAVYGDGAPIPRWVTVSPESDLYLLSWWRDLAGDDAIAADCSVHRPDWVTDASWLRVCRLLGWRPRY